MSVSSLIYFYFSEVETQVCENVTLALDYKFYWEGNGITSIKMTRTVGTVTLNESGKSPFLMIWFNTG